jgi:hypothetical protein
MRGMTAWGRTVACKRDRPRPSGTLRLRRTRPQVRTKVEGGLRRLRDFTRAAAVPCDSIRQGGLGGLEIERANLTDA